MVATYFQTASASPDEETRPWRTAPRSLTTTTSPGTSAPSDADTPGVGTGLVGAPECGDVMKLPIKVSLETGVIEDARFKTFGCGSAIASSSLAPEWLKGKTIEEAGKIKKH